MLDYLDVVTDILGVFEDSQCVHKLNTVPSARQQETGPCMGGISLPTARTILKAKNGYRRQRHVELLYNYCTKNINYLQNLTFFQVPLGSSIHMKAKTRQTMYL